MNPRISLLTLGVADLERSRRFYAEGLGLPLHPQSDDTVAFFDLKGTRLALWPRAELANDAGIAPEGSGFNGLSLAHNVATREEVDSVLAKAVRAGATVVRPAQDVFWGGYTAYFTDPDGFLWEIAWNPGMPELAD
ncbi:MAG: VOC family protein [Dehalococcoidia bacterium]|nr:VOC family protein [Dehalococcoidia bacterium]